VVAILLAEEPPRDAAVAEAEVAESRQVASEDLAPGRYRHVCSIVADGVDGQVHFESGIQVNASHKHSTIKLPIARRQASAAVSRHTQLCEGFGGDHLDRAVPGRTPLADRATAGHGAALILVFFEEQRLQAVATIGTQLTIVVVAIFLAEKPPRDAAIAEIEVGVSRQIAAKDDAVLGDRHVCSIVADGVDCQIHHKPGIQIDPNHKNSTIQLPIAGRQAGATVS